MKTGCKRGKGNRTDHSHPDHSHLAHWHQQNFISLGLSGEEDQVWTSTCS